MTQAAATNLMTDRIDEIPTSPSAQKAVVVSIATTMLGGLGLGFWYFGASAFTAVMDANVSAAIHLEKIGFSQPLSMTFVVFGILGGMCHIAGLLSLLRSMVTYQMVRAVLALIYPVMLCYVLLVWLSIFSLVDADIEINGAIHDRAMAIVLWWSLCWPALAVSFYTFWLHMMLQSRSVHAAFTRREGPAMRGDRVLEDWRTHGRDPRARKSFYGSFITHVVILILIPWLMQMGGCVEAYRIPKGSGNPVVALVKIVKPKKKEKKKLTLRSNSAIIFEIPDMDDLEVDKKMDEMTQARYEAKANAKPGKLGAGGGKQGGWPTGRENYRIRFIRLKHSGDGWDDGMNQTGADINFLRTFAQITGHKKIASKGESHPIAYLARYPDDGYPPFVYLTGNSHMGRTTPKDRKILREYCLKGGMLIADAGSRRFHDSFTRFIGQVFPDKPLLDIADDDMIYQLPFGFPNGAPAFWHHGGRRALGIKHEGRWVVFYHPGDMNDAWKLPGYSDVTPEMRDAAMHLGVNLINYAITQMDAAVTKANK